MLHWILYIMMLVGYVGLSVQAPTIKMKIIGVLLTVVNGMLFWKV